MRAFVVAVLACWFLPAAAADLAKPVILVAKPELRDQFYRASVLVVAPLGGDQHVGFIVNRPTELRLETVFPEHAPSQKVVDPVFLRGPLQSQQIFALGQRRSSQGGNAFQLMPGLYAAFEGPVVDRIIESDPARARFIAGLVAWQSGELRAEIDLGAWEVLEPDAALIMGNPEGLWEGLLRRAQRSRNTI